MSIILLGNILVDGVAYAMILFVITVGLSITMGLMRVANLAHGAFAMLGGFLALKLPTLLGVPILVGFVIAIIAIALIAIPIERLLLRRLYQRSHLDQMLVTIGFMYICVALTSMAFGSDVQSVALPDFMTGVVDLGFRSIPCHRIYVTAIGIAVLALLWITVQRSSFGIRVRAAVDSASIAQSVGINTPQIYAVAFALGAGLAALGGIAGAELLPMESSYPAKYLVAFLAVVAVGGQGSLPGSFIASLLLGMIETATKYLLPSGSSIAFFLTMFVVLLVKPQGLLGKFE